MNTSMLLNMHADLLHILVCDFVLPTASDDEMYNMHLYDFNETVWILTDETTLNDPLISNNRPYIRNDYGCFLGVPYDEQNPTNRSREDL